MFCTICNEMKWNQLNFFFEAGRYMISSVGLTRLFFFFQNEIESENPKEEMSYKWL